jgi:hypothetical protein
MSDHRLLGLLLGVVALSAPLHAQERERLARREAELSARLAVLKAHEASDDSTRFVDQRRTIVSAGPFHVAYPEWAAREARHRLPELVEERRRRYGVALDSLLTDTLYIWVDDSAHARQASSTSAVWRMGALGGQQSITLQGGMRSDWVTWTASTALEQWAQSVIDPEFTRWLGPTNPRMEFADLRDGSVRELILSTSSRGRRCLDGSIEECELLLELQPVPDPLLQAYDPADYRGLVERPGTNDYAGRSRCVTGRELATCVEILQRPGRRPIRALSGRVRQSLMTFAMMRGGGAAWLRLSRAAGRPIAEQLASASGMPSDSLLAEWQRDLRAGRRTTEGGLTTGFLMMLAWGVLGSLFFAWRYRWRHV